MKRTAGLDMSEEKLSPRDYFAALLQEHTLLRDEVKYRTLMRNGIMVGALAAAGVATARLFSVEDDGQFAGSALVLIYFLLPCIWYGMLVLQVVLVGQTDRVAQAVCIVELKIELLFDGASEDLLIATRQHVGNAVWAKLGERDSWSPKALSAPIIWERLVRSKRRLFDKPRLRVVAMFFLAFVLSSAGPVVHATWPGQGTNWKTTALWLLAYLITAVLFCLVFARKRALGRWTWHNIPEAPLVRALSPDDR